MTSVQQGVSLNTRSKEFSPKNKKDLGMGLSYSTPQKVKKQGEMPLRNLGPIPSLNSAFFNGMGPRLDNGVSPCLFTFLRGGV